MTANPIIPQISIDCIATSSGYIRPAIRPSLCLRHSSIATRLIPSASTVQKNHIAIRERASAGRQEQHRACHVLARQSQSASQRSCCQEVRLTSAEPPRVIGCVSFGRQPGTLQSAPCATNWELLAASVKMEFVEIYFRHLGRKQPRSNGVGADAHRTEVGCQALG